MPDEVDIPLKRGRGRPSKLSVSLGIPAYSRRSIELEEERLDREEAAFQERRNLLRERKEKQRNRCITLLGEGLLELAGKETAYQDVCMTIIGQMKMPDDRDLVSSWIPGANSSPSIEPPAVAANAKPPQEDKHSGRNSGAVTDPAPTASVPSEAMSSHVVGEKHASMATELPLQTPMAKRHTGARGGE